MTAASRSPDPRFRTTRWSLVLSVAEPETAAAALGELCELYWYPLYAYLRRRGTPEADALDLVQGFLARLLERRDLAADPDRGRFRTYLLGGLRHYVQNQHRAARTAARGGGWRRLSLDDAEARYRAELADDLSPEALFDHRWALALLERALDRLRQEYRARNRDDQFAALEHTLAGEPAAATYAEIAARLGVTESAVKVAVHRLRRRLRELVRDEVAQTVTARGGEVDAELRHLFEALAR